MNEYTFNLTQEQLHILIILLELSEREISRNFKHFTPDDMDLKEIYYNYRLHCRQLRRQLKILRGY